MCYPTTKTVDGRIYEDVGVEAFVNKIIECLPTIYEDINRPGSTPV